MNILSIDTSTDLCNVGLIRDTQILAEYRADFKRAHAEKLISAIQFVLDGNHLELNDVDGIAISIGPGSFTGLRIGLATAKGFCFANGTKLVGINTLDSLAENAILWKGTICTLIHAQAEEFYMCLYESDTMTLTRLDDYKIVVIKDLVELMTSEILFISPHSKRIIDYLEDRRFDIPRFARSELNMMSGLTMARLGLERLKRGEQDDPELLQPFYLKDFKAKKKGEHKIVQHR